MGVHKSIRFEKIFQGMLTPYRYMGTVPNIVGVVKKYIWVLTSDGKKKCLSETLKKLKTCVA